MAQRRVKKAQRSGAWVLAAVMLLLVALGGLYYLFAGGNQPASGGSIREFSHIHGLGVDPQQTDTVWLATHEGLIRMQDAGTWTYVGETRPDLMGFTVSQAEAGVFYTSGHPGPGVKLPNPMGFVTSRDGGQTWQPVSLTGKADFHAMTVSGADPKLAFGWFGELYRSEDQGRTWKQLRPQALSGENGAPLQFAAHPGERNVLLAATMQGLLRSKDLGETWEIVLAEPVTAVSYVPSDPEQILTYQLGRGLLRSPDGGKSWQSLGYAAEGQDAVGYIAAHPTDPGVTYVATFKANLARTRDGGATWETLATAGKVTDK